MKWPRLQPGPGHSDPWLREFTMTAKRNSTPVTPRSKPDKPRPYFPLFAHATGYWAKKVRGKLVYFGKWDDPEGAQNNLPDTMRNKEGDHHPTGNSANISRPSASVTAPSTRRSITACSAQARAAPGKPWCSRKARATR